jgi:hypothetical protein
MKDRKITSYTLVCTPSITDNPTKPLAVCCFSLSLHSLSEPDDQIKRIDFGIHHNSIYVSEDCRGLGYGRASAKNMAAICCFQLEHIASAINGYKVKMQPWYQAYFISEGGKSLAIIIRNELDITIDYIREQPEQKYNDISIKHTDFDAGF